MPRDETWAREKLEEYLAQLDRYIVIPRDHWGAKRSGEEDQIREWCEENQDTVRPVAEELVPDTEWRLVGEFAWEPRQRSQLRRALGVMQHRVELAEHWSGDPAIEIDPNKLHPWVWNAARDLWASDHWGEAVEAVAKVLNAQMQHKSGLNTPSESKLVSKLFSLDSPKPGEVRLRVADDDGSDTYKSKQQGAMFLGQAVFTLWRNVLAHEPGGEDEQPAIEALAAMSTFARLLDDAEVERDS